MSDWPAGTIVIVGAGLAGGRAALALRREGFDGRVVLLGDEGDPPYERPHISKKYLLGEETWKDLALAGAEAWDASGIDLRTGVHVDRLDLAGRTVHLADGEDVAYDRLLIATGSAARRPSVAGGALDGVHLLRTRADGDRLRAAIDRGGRVVVIGGGWIGSEVAAVARTLGSEVVIVFSGPTPLARALGPEVGAAIGALHEHHGVELRPGTLVASIERQREGLRVRTRDGGSIDGAVVVAGVGANPRVGLARAAGLTLATGIVTDEMFRTSDPHVWAVGDVAEAWHPLLGARIRLEHWAAAYFGGPAAARSLLDRGAPYERIPYLYSDQYDSTLEQVGWAPTWDRVVMRGDPRGGPLLAFWLRDDRVAAALQLDQPDARKPLEALVRHGGPLDPVKLADPAIDLTDLPALAPS